MIRVCRARDSFVIKTIGANKLFDAIKLEIEDNPYRVILTKCDANIHVDEVIKRMTRLVKDRVRLARLDMP